MPRRFRPSVIIILALILLIVGVGWFRHLAPPPPVAQRVPIVTRDEARRPTLAPRVVLTAVPTLAPSPTPAPSPAPTETPIPPSPLPTAEADVTTGGAAPEREARLLALVNQFRVEQGCPALQPEERLGQAARAHAEDLARRRVVDHLGANGATLRERLASAGYPAALAGETIAATFPDARAVLDAWTLGDELPNGPHRANLLDCRFAEAGAGVVLTDDGDSYWVLDLARQDG